MRTGSWIHKGPRRNSNSISNNSNNNISPSLSRELRLSQFTIVNFGLIAGLISSLAISGLILMVEKATAVPVGTFYMVLMAALTESPLSSVNMIVSGFALWSILFLPITFWMVFPLVSSIENQLIEQQVPTGPIASIETDKLSDMSNKIIFGAIPFNMFYGLLAAIIIKSLSENYLRKTELFKNVS